jgi:hypothetical protein
LFLGVVLIAAGLVTLPLTASAVIPAASTFTTKNLTAIGYSARVVPTANATPGAGVFNSDLAFWGNTAVQGTYEGFRLIDISNPANPTQIVNWDSCGRRTEFGPPTPAQNPSTTGNQGDVIVWRNLVFRSWNSPTPPPQQVDPADPTDLDDIPTSDPRRFTVPGAFCDNWPMYREPAAPPLPERGQEGIHVIDISNPLDPVVVAFIDAPCGSHTATGVPDPANNRFLIYNSASANTVFGGSDPAVEPIECRGVDIMEIPLANPAAASYLRQVPSGDPAEPPAERHACHDTGVILGDALKMACAGGDAISIFTLDPAEGGSLDDPMFMHHVEFPGVSIGHTAAFSADGEIAIFGHEPGGGSGARCQATSSVVDRTIYFVNVEAGTVAGSLLHPRPQHASENCTWHNLNVVPTNKGRFFVSGNYQSGISVVDFTDPAAAKEIAYADPAPLDNPDSTNPNSIELGGDWSSYYYNGYIYESDITRGLLIWDRESEADLEARQAAERAAFDAAQKAALDAFTAQQATAEAEFLAALAVREAACRQIADRLQQKRCLQALNQERLAFERAQREALKAFKTNQRAEAAAFEQNQKGNREDWRWTGVALKSAKTLPHLNPQTLESSIELQDR